jgi:tetratricopeptide (TPR) repeat protein
LTEHFPEIAKGRAEVVAQHFTEAGLASEALNYWVKAGRIAYARWANREAVEFFEQALRVLGSLSESRSTLEQAFDIRLELPQALIQLREIPRALERLEECEPLAERLNDDRRRCRMLSFKAVTYALTGELEEAVSAGTRALEFARRLGDLSLRIPASTILQQVQFYRGEYENVVELARANLAAVPDELESEDFGLAAKPSVYDRGRLIFSLCELGGFEEAAKLQVEGMLLAAQTEHAYSIGWAHLASSWIHMLKGNWAQAQPLLEHATGVLKGGNVMLLIPIAISLSAWNLAQLGEASEAVSRLGEGEELLERHATGGLSGTLGWFYPWLGRAALVLGRLDDARRLSERALEFSPRQPGFAAHALHLLGDIATHPDRFQAKTGEIHYRKALAIAEPRGMRPLVAHCQLGLGKLYLRDGKRKRAYEHLTTATATYREMDMRFWLEQAEAEMHQME